MDDFKKGRKIRNPKFKIFEEPERREEKVSSNIYFSFPLLAMLFRPTDFLLAPHQANTAHGHPATAPPY
jgi:hypothetical protein